MSQQTIPSRTVTICDRCGASGVQGFDGGFRSGGLHMTNVVHWGIGADGSKGGITTGYDFCGLCASKFIEWKNELQEKEEG